MKVPRLTRLASAALFKWGQQAQMGIAQEECAELIAAINRQKRGRADNRVVALEVADVLIALESVKLVVGPELVNQALEQKALRLAERVGDEAISEMEEHDRFIRHRRGCGS